MITVDVLKGMLPKNMQGHADQAMADRLNQVQLDPLVAEEVRNNFLSYTKILSSGKYKMEDYLAAVAYVTHKVMGYSNQDSYKRTFPGRYANLIASGKSEQEISSYVAMYNKGKLVNEIMQQTLVPSWVLNQDVYQQAINIQVQLMTDDDVAPKVRQDAANSLLTHLKPPEVKKVELEMGVKESAGILELKATLAELASRQLQMIEQGVPAASISKQALEVVDAEYTEVKE